MNLTRLAPVGAVLAFLVVVQLPAQLRVRPVDLEDGAVALGLLLRQLKTTAVFMQATAHPDDETNALHVLLRRGQGVRTVLATATRGDGGQNEIGPELFDALAILRTEELAAVHRFDGTEQYFTRAVDFGYSFSVEETFEKWGKDEIIGDYVRLIRMTRPDVIVGMNPTGTGGGQHHQASGLLSREAFLAAADPARYPNQLKEGLRPWRAKKFYYTAGFGGGSRAEQSADYVGAGVAPSGTGIHAETPAARLKMTRMETSGYDAPLGRTYAEIGTEARSMHKSQAMPQLLSLPGPAQTQLSLMDSFVGLTAGNERSLFDGIDTSIEGLAQFAGASPPPALVAGLRAIAHAVDAAQTDFEARGVFAAAPAITSGLNAVRELRRQLAALGVSQDAVFNLDARLETKEREFTQAALVAHGVRLEALADDGLVVPSQSVRVSVIAASRGPHDSVLRSVTLAGFGGTSTCPAGRLESAGLRCDATVSIPETAQPTTPYWHRPGEAGRYVFDQDAPFGLPNRPTPFRAQVALTLSGSDLSVNLPVEYRYSNILDGEKRMELAVVPGISVRMTSEIAIAPGGRRMTPAAREIRVTVSNNSKGAADAAVRLEVPSAWKVNPPSVAVGFSREDEAQTVRFSVQPAATTELAEYPVRAVAAVREAAFDRGYQVVEYPHIRRRQLEIPAVTRLKVMDVRTPPNLAVGYVMGAGDQVPQALEQLGARVEMLDADRLAWGDLRPYHAIVIGVRAYDSRADLQANNKRILDYAANGGIVIVQYNRGNDWTRYAPYPARASNTRVTDERGQIEILAAENPLFRFPNAIGERAWAGWVQERGTYFMAPQDPRYTNLIRVYEPFENNRGWKQGALVEAVVGKGRWVFVGLGLWRQVTAGTDGAYQLWANLISRGLADR